MSTTDKPLIEAAGAAHAERMETGRVVAPAVDIFESERELLLRVDLPGVAREDLSLQLDREQLTLEARRKVLDDDPSGAWNFTYRRAFRIPPVVEPDGVDAELKEGVLHLHLPKRAALQPRQIQVKAG